MTESLSIVIYVYAYFSRYAYPGDAPKYIAQMYETTNCDYVLVDKYARELEFEVPDDVAQWTPARLAAFAAKKAAISLAAAEEIKEIDDEVQKLLSIEYEPA